MGSRLFRKYALFFSALVGLSLLLSGLLGIHDSYRENKRALMRLQQEKAQAAALRIAQYLTEVELKIATTTEPQAGVSALDQRKAEIQILRRTRAIKSISLLDPQGLEVLRVSRLAADVQHSGHDFSKADWFARVRSGLPYRSTVRVRDEAMYVTVAMAVGPPAAGITVVEIDLEFLLEGITQIKVGDTGLAYVVDEGGHLIAHPDMGLVLQHKDMAPLPQVKAALRDRSDVSLAQVSALDMAGKPVLTSFGVIPYLNWIVFVQQPTEEAYRPLYAQALRGILLVLAGMVLTVLATVALVRKMVQPIRALRDGAKLIGHGVFDQPITVHTGDELEDLADEFNQMAEKLNASYTLLEQKVAQRTLELRTSEQSLKEAQQIAGLGSYEFEVVTNRWTSSEVLDTLLGIAPTYPHTPEGWTALLHPDDRRAWVKYFADDLIGEGRAFDKVLRIVRYSDQATRWVHGLGRVERDASGHAIKVKGTIQDITDSKLLADKVRQLAFYDPLTGLPNRRLLDDRLNQSMAASKRSGQYAAVMFLDLDNFKPLNDAHGHGVGDLLLVEVARRLTECVREMDTVARLGGDEFVVMLSELDTDKAVSIAQAHVVAEKIRTSLALPYHLAVVVTGQTAAVVVHQCSASIGVAVFVNHEATQTDILKWADAAMYRAKEAGRNAVRFHQPSVPNS
jgi:diguanylate cyclase (GGDEF)-like protein